MTLRSVTIWTTFGLLIVMMGLPVSTFLALKALNVNEGKGLTNAIPIILIFWFFTALPLAVSCMMGKYQKYNVSLIVLLASTIIYGILYVSTVLQVFFIDGYCCLPLFIWPFVTIFPAWIIVPLLNSYYKKTTGHPGADAPGSCDTPGSCVSLK